MNQMGNLLRLLGLVVVLGLVGCGAVKDTPTEVAAPAPTESIKTSLSALAQTGEKDSGFEMIGQEIENLRASDPAKADELSKGFEELRGLNDPAKVKAKAQEMASKL
ncbi:MAG: hypothetical protein MUF06_02790 [Pirellulaceae bacterium]|jgi:hypothetical protein|nr:hypothetical protein [Pirellulaceae bacterium]